MKIHWTRWLALRAIRSFGPRFLGSALYRRRHQVYVITITECGAMDVLFRAQKGSWRVDIKTPF